MQKFTSRWINKPMQSCMNYPNNLLDRQQLSRIQLRQKCFSSKTSQQYLGENTTINSTCNNSLAKNQKVKQSTITIPIPNRPSQKQSNANKSLSKRKKFLSVTQKSKSNKSFSSEKKSPFIKINQFSIQSTLNKSNQHEQFTSPKVNQSFQNSIRQYVNNIIKNVTRQMNTQEKIVSQEINPNQKSSSLAQKAKQQRNVINLLLKRQKRSQTEFQQDLLNTENQKHMTEYFQTLSSRNKLFSQQNIGQNTLTRQDSPILGLIQMLQHAQCNIHKKQISDSKSAQNYMPPEKGQLFQKLKYQLKTKNNDRNKLLSCSQNEKYKNQLIHINKQNQTLKSKSKKKIKLISLVQKQQQCRYKNNLKTNQLRQQYKDLKSKIDNKRSKI